MEGSNLSHSTKNINKAFAIDEIPIYVHILAWHKIFINQGVLAGDSKRAESVHNDIEELTKNISGLEIKSSEFISFSIFRWLYENRFYALHS